MHSRVSNRYESMSFIGKTGDKKKKCGHERAEAKLMAENLEKDVFCLHHTNPLTLPEFPGKIADNHSQESLLNLLCIPKSKNKTCFKPPKQCESLKDFVLNPWTTVEQLAPRPYQKYIGRWALKFHSRNTPIELQKLLR